MAASKKKAKPLTREELEAMPHSELASVRTKRRLLEFWPSAADDGDQADKRTDDDEDLTPRQLMRKGIAQSERARKEKEAGNGNDEN